MALSDIREWAVKGAEQRLLEISAEARAIFRAFPELRRRGKGFEAPAVDNAVAPTTRGRRRRKMSAKQRKAISARMKKFWAGRRKK